MNVHAHTSVKSKRVFFFKETRDLRYIIYKDLKITYYTGWYEIKGFQKQVYIPIISKSVS